MPQDILETLVRCSSSGGKKISPLSDPDPNQDPSLPPESITIPLSSVQDLPSALSYDRDDSAKESTNPKSHHPNNNHPSPNPNLFRSGSQRYAKTSGPILGLPNRIKNVTCSSRNYRSSTTTTNSRIFPRKKKPGSVPIEPPSSPKVSCFGKVLSDRERNRNCKSPKKSRWFVSLFACGGLKDKKKGCEEDDKGDDVARKDIVDRNASTEEMTAPGLGGMMRFASGRRSASWGSDVEAGHVAVDLKRRSVDGCGAL